jgi:disulfide bond formation protein DsbB
VRVNGFSGTRVASLTVLAIAAATIAGALASQHIFGLAPCKLCLQQRWPYYVGVPLAAFAAVLPRSEGRRMTLGLLALIFLGSAGLAGYHAGIEWGFWLGPADCGGGTAPSGSVDDLLKGLGSTRIVSCTDAAWRFLGLSLAGWNALVSLALAAIAATGSLSRR